jgi:HK97 family phage portal protein
MQKLERLEPSYKSFPPSAADVDWTRIETLVHGPGAGDTKDETNSALFACLMAIATSYPEPPLIVNRKISDGEDEPIEDHPIKLLLDSPTPNGELSIDEILFWTAWAKHTDGNAYWRKIRSGDPVIGNVVQLWPISPTLIKPFTEKGSDDWISYYKFRFAPNQYEAIPVANIIHFKLGLDDQDMRLGLSPLKALIRELTSDNEADDFVSGLLQNYAVPGLVVVPSAANVSITEADAARIEAKIDNKFGGKNRGKTAVFSKDTRIEQFGYSPSEMDMTVLHRIPEERISAVLGVPAIVAGLGAGLEAATYDNARSMGEWFTERKLIPLWRTDARKITTNLRPDFTDDKDIFVEFDLSDVRALQEDEDSKYERLYIATGNKAFLTVNEVRSEIGYDPLAGEDELSKPVPPALQPSQDGDQPPSEEEMMAAEEAEFRAYAIKHIGAGLPINFRAKHIHPLRVAALTGALEGVTKVEDVDTIFTDEWRIYP